MAAEKSTNWALPIAVAAAAYGVQQLVAKEILTIGGEPASTKPFCKSMPNTSRCVEVWQRGGGLIVVAPFSSPFTSQPPSTSFTLSIYKNTVT